MPGVAPVNIDNSDHYFVFHYFCSHCMINVDFTQVALKLRRTEGKTTVFDPIRRKWVVLTPEEHVRQYVVAYLLEVLRYPAALIAVEKGILVGKLNKRFDIVVYDRDHKPWLLAECKAPEVPITEATLHQLLNYQQTIQCRYWLLTNGHQVFCAEHIPGKTQWLLSLPAYDI